MEKLEIAQSKEYNSSEVVFIGNIISVSEDLKYYNLTIVEVFKGNLTENDTIKGINYLSCEPIISQNGNWLLYGRFNSGLLNVNTCGLSRDINAPMRNRYFTIIPLPPENYSDTIKIDSRNNFIKNEEQNNEKAMDQLKLEISKLRLHK